MKTCVVAILLLVVTCLGITSASQLQPKEAAPAEATSQRSATAALGHAETPWIPVGKFGLVLNDGTRVIGVPSKRWAATLKTRFGRVTIPHEQLAGVVPFGGGEIRILLTNGDRISGTFATASLLFETPLGLLNVPTKSLVSMRARRKKNASVVESLMPRLKGDWVVTYTNKTQHTRRIDAGGMVNGAEELVEKDGDLLIVYQGVIERITLVEDRLFVEHFNPGSTYPHGIPTVMGVGKKTASQSR